MEEIEGQSSKYLTLYNFYHVLFKRKGMAVFLFCFTFGLIFFSYILMEPRYKAVTKVMARHNKKQDITFYKDLQEVSLGNFRVNPMSNLVEIVKSRELAGEIVRHFRLDERLKEQKENPKTFRDLYYKYYSQVLRSPVDLILWGLSKMGVKREQAPPPDYFQMAIDKFLDDIQAVLIVVETEVLSIEIWGASSEEASEMANLTAELLIREVRKIDAQEAQTALDFAQQQYQRILAELLEAEQDALAFKKANNIIDEEEQGKIFTNQLEKLEASRIASFTQKVECESRIATIKAQLEKGFILPKTYQELSTQLASAQNELSTIKDRLAELEAQIEKTKRQAIELAENRIQLGVLQREVESRKSQVKMLRDVMEKLEVQRLGRLSEHDFVIIEEAKPWKAMDVSWPNSGLFLLLGILSGLTAALLVPFFVEYWRETFTTPEQIEKRLGVGVIATLPEFPRGTLRAGSPLFLP